MSTMSVFQLPCANLVVSEHNPRADVGDLEELAANIRSMGVLEPLLVTPDEGNGKGRVVAGKRRLAAARLAGLRTVPCILLRSLSPLDETAVSFVENYHRKAMSPIEEGEGIKALVAGGVSKAEIGRTLGMSPVTFSQRYSLVTDLIPGARAWVHSGWMPLHNALWLAALDAEVQERLCRLGMPTESEIGAALDAQSGGSAQGRRARARTRSHLEQRLVRAAALIRREEWGEAWGVLSEVLAAVEEKASG